MKKTISLILISSVFVACGSTTKGEQTTVSSSDSQKSASEEPAAPPCVEDAAGSDVQSAAALALGVLKGCLLGTEDFYKVRASEHAAGTAYTLAATGGYALTAFDSEKNELATAAAGETLYVAIAANTDVFVRVARDAGAAAGPYDLDVGARPLDDADEPNDTTKQAKPLNLGQFRDGLLQTLANNPDSANDYYRVLVGRKGQISIEVNPGTDEVSISATLLRANGEEIERSEAANSGGAVKVTARVKAGEYFIRVAPSTNDRTRAAAVATAPRYWSESYSIRVDVK